MYCLSPKHVLTPFLFTLISFLLIRIISHYITFSSLPFKNECSVNDYAIIHHFYCNHFTATTVMIMFHHFSDSNVAMFHHFSDSNVPPFLRFQRCYVPPFLRLQYFSDSTISPTPPFLRLQCFSDSTISPTPTLLSSTISPTPMFLRLHHFSDSTTFPTPMFLRLHHFSAMTSFLKNSKYLLVIFYMYVHHQ